MILANTSQDSINMFIKTTQEAANSIAPINKKKFHTWKKYWYWCKSNGFNPFKASDQKVVAYLSTRAEFTASPNIFERGVLSDQKPSGLKVVFHLIQLPFSLRSEKVFKRF